jgi:acetyl esterase/lipase
MLKKSNLNQKLRHEIDHNLLDQHPHDRPSRTMIKKYHIKTEHVGNHVVYTWSYQEKCDDCGIFYLHGGAYVHGLSKMHFRLFQSLIHQTGATMVVPDYPLVPHASVEDIYPFLKESYRVSMHPFKHVVIMGDSAGGGLALGLAQQLKRDGIDHVQVMLLSPWLDVSMDNITIDAIQPLDPILNRETLRIVGNMYARGRNLKDPLLSPLYGNLKGIEAISVWIGTRDILYADAIALAEKAKEESVVIDMNVYEDMLHTWMFFGLKESRKAINEMATTIKKIKNNR